MSMSSFQVLFPEVARKETRTAHVLRPGNFNLPVDEYGFLESYCDQNDCDCRRAMISVFGANQGKVLASIGLGFDSGEVGAGPFLDPLGPQSIHSQDLLRLFTNVINDDPDYLARLQQHYTQYKEKIDGNPYNGRPFEDPHSVKRTPSDLEDAFAGPYCVPCLNLPGGRDARSAVTTRVPVVPVRSTRNAVSPNPKEHPGSSQALGPVMLGACARRKIWWIAWCGRVKGAKTAVSTNLSKKPSKTSQAWPFDFSGCYSMPTLRLAVSGNQVPTTTLAWTCWYRT